MAAGATTPDQVDELYAVGMRNRDADALAALYEEDAVYAMSMAGVVIEGRDAIRDSLIEMFAVMEDVDLTFEPTLREHTAGDGGSRRG